MKIKTGDKVKVIAGKDKGKNGKVIQVFPKLNKIVVEGVNVLKKHLRPQKKGEKGQRIELPAPISGANVMLIDQKSGKPTRIGYKLEGKTKKRYAKVSGEFI
jgi:large subunit ribosomal protein L24